ncbi:MAG: aldo/keto reductase [Clostridiales Family XIII bacterium]|jgi:predicted aldo/keto reductase-like oxidoreductase|nr:aldo/keto reductase [Clostridiales Family XIII bacterium]
MLYKELGKTGLNVSAVSFGALPLMRLQEADAVELLRAAYDAGINYFDTARHYQDSENKVGEAFKDVVREKIYIATKTYGRNRKDITSDLEESLSRLKTDYIDLYQLHNLREYPEAGSDYAIELYDTLLEAKKKGYIRHIGVTTHRFDVAQAALDSDVFETIMFPLSYLATDKEIAFTKECSAKGKGCIAMKALSGGLVRSIPAAYAFLNEEADVVPIWGMQRISELNEFIALEKAGVKLNEALWSEIKKDKEELAGNFCRGCAYCMPCPVGIEIEPANRMALFLGRTDTAIWLNDKGRARMDLIKECKECRQCVSRCPYELNVPETLKQNLKVYDEYYERYLREKA